MARPRYRYQNPGGTIGGPLIIPGTRFNKARQKLFFFFSYDKLFNSTVNNATYTMPTALERPGDFSKTVTTTGVQVPIFDPTTQTPFPGKHHPRQPHQPAGAGHAEPVPAAGSGWAWRSTRRATAGITSAAVLPQLRPLDDKILRVDYNISPKLQTFVRLLQDYQAAERLQRHGGPSGRRLGTIPGQLPRAGGGRLGHG